jgi:hypothetical protein
MNETTPTRLCCFVPGVWCGMGAMMPRPSQLFAIWASWGGWYASRGKVELVYVSRATKDRGAEMDEMGVGRWEMGGCCVAVAVTVTDRSGFAAIEIDRPGRVWAGRCCCCCCCWCGVSLFRFGRWRCCRASAISYGLAWVTACSGGKMGTETGMVRKEQTRCKRKRRIDDQNQNLVAAGARLLALPLFSLLSLSLANTRAVSRLYPLAPSQANPCTAASRSPTPRLTPPHTTRTGRPSSSLPLSRLPACPPAEARINNQAKLTVR